MKFTKNYYINIDSLGNNKGIFPPNYMSLDDIKTKQSDGDYLVLISETFYNTFLQNSKKITKLLRPKFKADKIQALLKENILDWTDEELIKKFPIYCETTELPVFERTFTQEQKDIKFLAETLITILEPNVISKTNKSNPLLEKLHEIVGRYSD